MNHTESQRIITRIGKYYFQLQGRYFMHLKFSLAIPLTFLTTVAHYSPVMSAEAEKIETFRSLNVEAASKAAWEALRACRKQGYSVAVAVVDRGGNVQALLRDRYAGPHTPETATRKAWTANSFRQPTATLAELLQQGKIPNQVQHNPGALLVGGGLLIESAGQIIGGIGVSGAPPGKSEKDSIDGACAQSGLDAIQELLEMGD
ncbi:MAG: heme-binding protein [Pseudomonadota bacterium]